MTTKQANLPNGLRIVTAEMTEAQSVTVSIFAGVGSRYEDYSTNGGVSHMLEHLLFKGTAKRPTAKQISEEIDAVGGWNNAYTSNDLTCYYVKVPKQHAALALDILSDLVQNPLFDPVEVDRERSVIVEEIGMIGDDPARYVGNLLAPLIWPHDPLGRPVIGSEKVVRTIEREAIVEYKGRHYGPNNLVVAVAGQINHESVVEQVERQMGAMEPIERPALPALRQGWSKQLTATLKDDTNQAHFLIGCEAYPYEHPDEAAARVVTAILGRGMSSRLFIGVRERQGLAYAVSADYQSFVDTGLFEAYAGVSPDKTDLATRAVMAELERIRIEPIDKLELMKAKNQLRGGLQMALESNTNVADRMGAQLTLLDKLRTPEQLLAEIDAVSLEDVTRVASEMLAPQRLRLAIIAPDPTPAEATFKELVSRNYAKK